MLRQCLMEGVSAFLVISHPNSDRFCFNLGSFKAAKTVEDRGPETVVLVPHNHRIDLLSIQAFVRTSIVKRGR